MFFEFNDGTSMTIDLPHVPPTTYLTREVSTIPPESEFEYGLSTSINQRPFINTTLPSQSSQHLESEEFISMAQSKEVNPCI